jgi:type IV secretory pathway TrbD component
MLRKFLRFATWISIALVVLFWIAAFAVSHQIYRLDPLHFFERGTTSHV